MNSQYLLIRSPNSSNLFLNKRYCHRFFKQKLLSILTHNASLLTWLLIGFMQVPSI